MSMMSITRLRLGVAAIGLAALAVLASGCTAETVGAAAPGSSTPATDASASPTAAWTSTPASSPAPQPSSPSVRVPASCEDLLPTPAGATLDTSTPHGDSPADYAGERAGMLRCTYTDPQGATLYLGVVADVDAEDYHASADGIDWGPLPADPSLSPDARAECPVAGRADLCQLIDLENGYGITASLFSGDQSTPLAPEQLTAFTDALSGLTSAVAALGEPAPLWYPAGADIPGATAGCEGLVSDDTMNGLLGTTRASVAKSDDGEYARFPFRVAKQVGSEWCLWFTETETGAGASVLPGGAQFMAGSMDGSERYDWQPAPDFPGEAYLATQEGSSQSTVNIAIDGAWVQVSAPMEALPALVDAVLQSVGADSGSSGTE
jgi:hypothetical protein